MTETTAINIDFIKEVIVQMGDWQVPCKFRVTATPSVMENIWQSVIDDATKAGLVIVSPDVPMEPFSSLSWMNYHIEFSEGEHFSIQRI